jgi:hypothetical protein
MEIERRMGHRSFGGISENVLDRKLWDVLDKMGDNSIFDIMNGFDEKMEQIAKVMRQVESLTNKIDKKM